MVLSLVMPIALAGAVARALRVDRFRSLFSVASVGYLPDWEYSSTLLSKMDWAALTQVNYFSTTANSSTSTGPSFRAAVREGRAANAAR